MKLSTFCLLVSAVALPACGADSAAPRLFSTDWRDDQGKSIAAVEARVRGARVLPVADVAVGVAGKNDKLVGTPLSQGPVWVFQHALDSRPVTAGSVVVGSGNGEVFALDAMTGRKLWARSSDGGEVVGAGDDGAVTAVTFARKGGSTVLVIGHDGIVQRKIESEKPLGDPAVVGGIVLVP